jgi:hypothetical protein
MGPLRHLVAQTAAEICDEGNVTAERACGLLLSQSPCCWWSSTLQLPLTLRLQVLLLVLLLLHNWKGKDRGPTRGSTRLRFGMGAAQSPRSELRLSGHSLAHSLTQSLAAR